MDLAGNLSLETFLCKLYSKPSFQISRLDLSRTYLSPSIIPQIFSSPQIIYLRKLALNCNPIVKVQLIDELQDSLQTKNLQVLELRHFGLSNGDLTRLCQGKWLGDLDTFDIRSNPSLSVEKVALCEGLELQNLKAVQCLLMDGDFFNSDKIH